MLNREAWLTELAEKVRPLFKGFHLQPFRLTCGWPCRNGLGKRARVVGECHALESSAGGFHEIFISPYLDEPLEVAGTVCHEIAHVAAGIAARHGKGFVKVCKHVGLISGKPTSVMPGDHLNDQLRKMIDKLGEYPHKALRPVGKIVEKKPTSVKVTCTECGCEIRMSMKWFTSVGTPTCACSGVMEVETILDDEPQGPH